MRPPIFESFVSPARTRPQVWRLVLGMVLSLLVYALVVLTIFAAIWLATETDPDFRWVDTILRADTPTAMLILLFTFSGMAMGPMVAARLLHKRKAGTLFGPAVRVLRDFVTAAAIVGTLLSLSLVGWSFFYDALPGIPFNIWITVLPLAVLGVLIQTGAEEIVFRGYLLQQLAARFSSPFIWAIVPALLFGIAHYSPQTAGANVWLVVGAAGIFGLIAADLTARSGSIGAAWGFHFANNTLALLIIATQGTLTGLALFRTPYSVSDANVLPAVVPLDLAVMILGWWLVRRAVAR